LGSNPKVKDLARPCFNGERKRTPARSVYTVWSIFPHDTKYFDPSASPFVINFPVKDLDGLLDQLKREGVKVDDKREEYDYGKFGWIIDPEGNRIELWEPKGQPPP